MGNGGQPISSGMPQANQPYMQTPMPQQTNQQMSTGGGGGTDFANAAPSNRISPIQPGNPAPQQPGGRPLYSGVGAPPIARPRPSMPAPTRNPQQPAGM